MIGKLKDMFRNRDGEWVISFTTRSDFTEAFDELSKAEVNVEIKKASKRRSNDANAFCWVLIDQIAEKTGAKRSEVYRNAIKEIGGVSETVCVQDRAVDRLREGWEKNGLGWQTDVTPSKIPGCTCVILYYGSSTYDSAQMSRLIDLLIQDAEALGIPTISEKELERMKGNLNEKHHAG